MELSASTSGPSKRKNLRSNTAIEVIDCDPPDIEEVAQKGPRQRTRPPSKRSRKAAENPGSPITVDDSSDEVRAPIPQSTDVLSGGDPFAVMSRNFTDLRKQYREGMLRQKKSTKAGGPGAVYDSLRDYEGDLRARHNNGASQQSTSAKSSGGLSDIYRPPVELLTYGSFETARARATEKTQWLLVNVHNYLQFQCQTFVRDFLRHDAVKEVIKENFIFWSVNHDSSEGLRYTTHYKVDPLNSISFPHLAIIDPRTGEKVHTYAPRMTVSQFCSETYEFLAEKPSYDPIAWQAKNVSSASTSAGPASVQRSESSNSNNSVEIIDPEDEDLIRAMGLSEQEERRRKEQEEKHRKEEIETVYIGDDDDDDDDAKTLTGSVEEARADPAASAAPAVDLELYKEFFGEPADPEVVLKIRLPNGQALDLALPNSSQLQAVSKFIESRGFPAGEYDIVTTYPKRSILELEKSLLLSAAGFNSREMLIVQQRD